MSAVLILSSLIWGALCGIGVFLIVVTYLAIQFLYNYRLKEIVILDIFCVSGGFFLRVVGSDFTLADYLFHLDLYVFGVGQA